EVGRRDTFGDRALVEDDAELRRADLVGRLVFRNDRPAVAGVAARCVPTPIEKREPGHERERGEGEPEWLRLEVPKHVPTVAGDDRRGLGDDTFRHRGDDRELSTRRERPCRGELRTARGRRGATRLVGPGGPL